MLYLFTLQKVCVIIKLAFKVTWRKSNSVQMQFHARYFQHVLTWYLVCNNTSSYKLYNLKNWQLKWYNHLKRKIVYLVRSLCLVLLLHHAFNLIPNKMSRTLTSIFKFKIWDCQQTMLNWKRRLLWIVKIVIKHKMENGM